MTVPHVRFHRAMAAVTLFVGLTVPSTASLVVGHAASGSLLASAAGEDDILAQAKALYAAASYDEALAMLDRLTSTSKADKTGVAEYRIFCLLALGRQEDAHRAIEGMLRDNPFYRPSDAQASPRIQATINDVRRQVLPEIVLSSYADAKKAFDQKDPAAAQQFDRLLTLLEDPDTKGVAAFNDLRTVVAGFRDLSQALVAPPPAPPPPAPASIGTAAQGSTPPVRSAGAERAAAPSAPANTPSPAPTPTPSPTKAVYDVRDADVTAPVAVTQRLPAWNPLPAFATSQYKGVLEVVIDAQGNVTSANMRAVAHPSYDYQLVQVARQWKFKPATRQGVPVPYMKQIDIVLRPVRAPE